MPNDAVLERPTRGAWSPQGRTFTFGPYAIHPERSAVAFSFEAMLKDGTRHVFDEEVVFPGVTEKMWRALPDTALQALAQSLRIILGLNYWKPFLAPEMRIEGPGLTREEAEFWNTVYTKGLAEFFFRAKVDFRGLVSFPYDPNRHATSTPLPHLSGALLGNGGGKDTVVSAEILKERGIPFDLFVWNLSRTRHGEVARLIGSPTVSVRRALHPKLGRLWMESPWEKGYPMVTSLTFLAVFAATLHGRRNIIFANEQSADFGNVEYLGVDVNHQWSKSSEAETLMQRHIRGSITPDIVQFSLVRGFSELELVRRFSGYPQYFTAFSSCNRATPPRPGEGPRTRGFWCRKCAKCTFIFACLSAFLPKAEVVRIVGGDLYNDASLVPTFKRLLGIEGFKPFECVGEPTEMIVAMHMARETGDYAGEPAIGLIDEAISLSGKSLEEMRREVFATKPALPIPTEFTGAAA